MSKDAQLREVNPGLDLRAVQPGILKVGTGWALRELEPACSVEPEAGFGSLEEEAASPRVALEA